jgi:hypothetical protein
MRERKGKKNACGVWGEMRSDCLFRFHGGRGPSVYDVCGCMSSCDGG